MITSKSGADETFVEGQERYGALLDNLFYIIYAVGMLAVQQLCCLDCTSLPPTWPKWARSSASPALQFWVW